MFIKSCLTILFCVGVNYLSLKYMNISESIKSRAFNPRGGGGSIAIKKNVREFVEESSAVILQKELLTYF